MLIVNLYDHATVAVSSTYSTLICLLSHLTSFQLPIHLVFTPRIVIYSCSVMVPWHGQVVHLQLFTSSFSSHRQQRFLGFDPKVDIIPEDFSILIVGGRAHSAPLLFGTEPCSAALFVSWFRSRFKFFVSGRKTHVQGCHIIIRRMCNHQICKCSLEVFHSG